MLQGCELIVENDVRLTISYKVVEIGPFASNEEIAVPNRDATFTGALTNKHFKQMGFLR